MEIHLSVLKYNLLLVSIAGLCNNKYICKIATSLEEHVISGNKEDGNDDCQPVYIPN